MNNDDEQRLKEAAQRNAEAMTDSSVFLALWNPAMLNDPIPLLQMGLALYMDKPIYVLAPQGAEIPLNLKRVAVKIEYYDRDSKDMSSLERATSRLLKDLDKL